MCKNKDPFVTKSKLDRLTNAVKKLQAKAKQESFKNTFERETEKISGDVKEQIDNLKSSFVESFNSLSNIMVEEFEAIRDDVIENVNSYCPMHRTTEHLTLLCSKYESQIVSLDKRQAILEKEVEKLSKNRPSHDFESLQSELSTNKDNYKTLCDHISDIIGDMNSEITSVKNEQKIHNQSIETIKRNISDLNQGMRMSKSFILNSSQKENDFNKSNTNLEIVTKEIKDITNIKNDIENMKNELANCKQSQDITNSLLLLEENDENLNQNVILLKELVEKCVQKSSLDQLEDTVISVDSEHKIFQKKIEMIESMIVKNRNDYLSQLSELEKFCVSKNENLSQAICHICRNLNITNPLI
ncbi:unnamed protein product [Moneuplotes crassus]|uniref:Uncharacterized protein n=1 Tax=Euplotes crassus TaxID=5936 RepID=A0AAD1XGP9_EUPCR|nr:unnamed protein product [Moneuplotes crassus]